MTIFEPWLLFFQQWPLSFVVVVSLFSLCIGSFLNVVIHRLPKMMEASWQRDYQQYFHSDQSAQTAAAVPTFNLAVPRSRCPKCQHPLALQDNIPLLSYALLAGRCRYCQTPISPRYPLVELGTALLSALVAWQLGPTPTALLFIAVTWVLVALSAIDIDTMLLPDQLTLPLLWLALMASVLGWSNVDATTALIGAACGYLALWSVFWLFKLATGKEGMGYGDFKLLAVFGALLGWQQLPLIIILSSLVGAVVGAVILTVQGRSRGSAIPFGPYIAAAGWIAMLWGDSITHGYLTWIGL